ncbi:ADP-ribosylglycohydrolase family protein [Streptomyces zingiberis]|uniref:ADP-ribosylglycohydrolase family protein n=1 Tax=Streptomyces zingiberis TaxID=2053010 RepID=A0ABX1BW65_9ACTN|nr:ADP-ribosylglycohydrolase family protein [Streptomyces zingiberis]NJQ01951.1 ADP-ribosylglycohydrolase family protein [Streptomyces zingiberis]
MTADPTLALRHHRALACLRGLAVGDALGALLRAPAHHGALRRRRPPAGLRRWTDDTAMACSVLEVLTVHGAIDQDALARSFAAHHDPARDYGTTVDRVLRAVAAGGDWREHAAALFGGAGSWGNGAAMRVAPLGAWYAGEPERAVRAAELSAYVTHQHREAVAGAMAVAAAASLAAAPEGRPAPGELLDAVVALVPRSAVRAGLRRARDLLDYGDTGTVAAVLGCGRRTSAHDTVPFTLWAAARHPGDYAGAFWAVAQAGGDLDTTGAIAGAVVAAAPDGAPPAAWLEQTEPLPGWVPGPGR